MRTGNIVICLFVSVLPVATLVLWLCAGAGSHLRCFCVEQEAASPGACLAVSPAVSLAPAPALPSALPSALPRRLLCRQPCRQPCPGTCFAVSPAVSPAVYLATPAPPHQEPFRDPRFRIPGTAIPYGRAGLSRTKRVLVISWCGKEGFPVPNEDKVQYFRRYSASSTESIPMIK